MKKNKFAILFFLIFGLLVSMRFKDEEPTNGKIGDVKYSILDEMRFKEINGDGWVLMDGRSLDISNQEFAEIISYGFEVIPDARGVFIRGMNVGRTNDGDTEIDRRVGSYQGDQILEHVHTLTLTHKTSDDTPGQIANDGSHKVDSYSKINTDNGHEASDIKKNLGKETRPRNITLFIYLKVKN